MTEPKTPSVGILGWGAYVPRYRLARELVAQANGWFNPALAAMARGERSVAGWDEDSITLAVEAARGALAAAHRAGTVAPLRTVMLASTTLPFADRQNAGVVAAAIDAPAAIDTLDLTGSQRAGTTALRHAFDTARARAVPVLVAAADLRKTRAASVQEMRYGDGAAALVVGPGNVLATLTAAATDSIDFVPQFRASTRDYDYAWEERWVRDEGLLKIVPATIARALAEAGLAPSDVDRFCLASSLPRAAEAVARKAGIAASAVQDDLSGRCGDTGAAHPLLLAAAALDVAAAGERIMVVSFGEGCDVLLFTVTDAIAQARADGAAGAVATTLAQRRPLEGYAKFLALRGTVDLERGMRAEVDKNTPLTLLARNREMVLGLYGGRCRACGTVQFPSGRYCVNPECNALDSQDPHRLADAAGSVMSYTADALTYCPDPPAYYGMVRFDGGGRMMADITDIDPGALQVGLRVGMKFRIKDFDPQRGFVRYFWKAAPLHASAVTHT